MTEETDVEFKKDADNPHECKAAETKANHWAAGLSRVGSAELSSYRCADQ